MSEPAVPEPIIHLRGVSKSFESGRVRALDAVDLDALDEARLEELVRVLPLDDAAQLGGHAAAVLRKADALIARQQLGAAKRATLRLCSQDRLELGL
jgi:hypothetical protein